MEASQSGEVIGSEGQQLLFEERRHVLVRLTGFGMFFLEGGEASMESFESEFGFEHLSGWQGVGGDVFDKPF